MSTRAQIGIGLAVLAMVGAAYYLGTKGKGPLGNGGDWWETKMAHPKIDANKRAWLEQARSGVQATYDAFIA